MRICMVTSDLNKVGGVENVVRSLAANFNKKHEVYLITRDRGGGAIKDEKSFKKIFIIKSRNYVSYLLKLRKILLRLKKEIDVFHFHNWSTIFPSIGIKINSLLSIHGTSFNNSIENNQWLRGAIYWLIEEISYNIPNILV